MSTTATLDTVETRIADLVSTFVRLPQGVRLDESCEPILQATTHQAVTSSEGGKRLRALLALDAYRALGGDAGRERRDAMLDLSCAIEVFQTAALVHDDIIDDADLRRGKPAAHKALAGPGHDAALGVGLGIMLGDLLATASVDIANDAAHRLPSADAINRAFLTMHREVEIGQVLDLAAVHCPMADPARLARTSLDVFRWKTASYTTIAPLELAMLAAGYPPEQARSCALAVGEPLGLAFQLTDDQRGELIAVFEADARTEAQTAHVIDLFHSTGAIERSRRRIEELWHRSLDAIAQMPADDDARRTLAAACARFVPSVHYTPREPGSM